MRRDVFVDSSLSLRADRFTRRVGRPRQTWAAEVRKEAVRLLGHVTVERMLRDRSPGAEKRWRAELEKCFPKL